VIYEPDIVGDAVRVDCCWQIEQVLEKSHVKSTRNWRVCMTNLIKVEDMKGVFKDCNE
jgi:hypothetical protein